MSYAEDLLRLVTLITRQHAVHPTDNGTVVSVRSDAMRAMVRFDDATVASPVKVSGHVHCREGDRVGLTKHGKEWYVSQVNSRIGGPSAAGVNMSVPTGNTVTTTVVNMPGDPSFSFTKRWDLSPLMLCGSATAFTTGAAASMGLYIGLTLAGVQTTYLMWELESPINVRFGTSTIRILPDAGAPAVLPAGVYTVNLMWARTVGAGTVNTNSPDDHVSAYVLELGA